MSKQDKPIVHQFADGTTLRAFDYEDAYHKLIQITSAKSDWINVLNKERDKLEARIEELEAERDFFVWLEKQEEGTSDVAH